MLTWTTQKNVGYFADFEQVVILLTVTQLGHLWLPSAYYAAPVWFTGRYAKPLVTSYVSSNPVVVSATDLRERFLLSGVFYLTLLLAFFKASLGASSSTSRLAGLHADLWNIALAQLFVWITVIHKSFVRLASI